MKRTLGLLAATALASAFLSQAEAAPVITVDPANQNVAVGGEASVSIDVSGLTQGVGGIQFDLAFDPTLLTGVSYSIDPAGAMGGPYDAGNDFSGGFGPDIYGNPAGNVDIVYLAEPLPASLADEGTGFTLATITFEGLADGLSPLTLSNFVLSESDGSTGIGGVTAVNGQICVGSSVNGNCNGGGSPPPPPPSAPEMDPSGALGALTLLAGGLAAIRGRRFKKVDAK
jgi:hypothetical protein